MSGYRCQSVSGRLLYIMYSKASNRCSQACEYTTTPSINCVRNIDIAESLADKM
jgi:hypothetical protein